jgi:hypothetical protein
MRTPKAKAYMAEVVKMLDAVEDGTLQLAKPLTHIQMLAAQAQALAELEAQQAVTSAEAAEAKQLAQANSARLDAIEMAVGSPS